MSATTAVLLFFGLPLLWLVSLSFRNAAEILVITINPVPKHPTLDNYREVLRSAQFPRFLLNSATLSAIGACGAIAVAAPAAYAFSRMRFHGRRMALPIALPGLTAVFVAGALKG
jgi:multiple sugar transport system permease protein